MVFPIVALPQIPGTMICTNFKNFCVNLYFSGFVVLENTPPYFCILMIISLFKRTWGARFIKRLTTKTKNLNWL
jgi:hypothetical protein